MERISVIQDVHVRSVNVVGRFRVEIQDLDLSPATLKDLYDHVRDSDLGAINVHMSPMVEYSESQSSDEDLLCPEKPAFLIFNWQRRLDGCEERETLKQEFTSRQMTICNSVENFLDTL